jgi:hypothetical protein
MSARDRAFVSEHIADREAIKNYFEAKGKSIPDWVNRQEVAFWNSQPDWRLAIHYARFIRQALVDGKGGKDLEELFLKIVAYADVVENLPLENTAQIADTKNRANLYFQKLFAQTEDLDRKYKLLISLDLTKGTEPLEPWEKLIPKR